MFKFADRDWFWNAQEPHLPPLLPNHFNFSLFLSDLEYCKQFIQPTFMIHIWSLTASNLWKVNIFSTIQIWNYMRASKQFNFWMNCPFPVFKTLRTFYSVKLNNNTCQIVLVWMSERHSRNEQDWLCLCMKTATVVFLYRKRIDTIGWSLLHN